MDKAICSIQYTLYSLLRKHGEVMSEKHLKNHFLVTNKTENAKFIQTSENHRFGFIWGPAKFRKYLVFSSFQQKLEKTWGKDEQHGSFRFVGDQEMIFRMLFRHDFPMLSQ